jgi:hypothetical protein
VYHHPCSSEYITNHESPKAAVETKYRMWVSALELDQVVGLGFRVFES